MNTQNTMISVEEKIVNQEKETVNAFKNKNKDLFTKYFSPDYIGVAADGIKTADDEVKGMMKLDLEEINVEDAKVSFLSKEIAAITYKMIVKGKPNNPSGTIYCSTVLKQQNDEWLAVLHTESIEQKN